MSGGDRRAAGRGRLGIVLVILCIAGCAAEPGALRGPDTRNIVIFVADGLRHDAVNLADSPTLLAARSRGVHFANSHALFPTLTTANGAALATGHFLGDTGIFSNTEYVGAPIFSGGSFGHPPGSPTPFLENDEVLADLDDRFPGGDFLGEASLLELARERGWNTAAIGKLGPAAIQDLEQVGTAGGRWRVPRTVIIDDATGGKAGVPLSPEISAALEAAGLTAAPPAREQPSGSLSIPGTRHANAAQQQWLVDATTKVVLPAFVRNGRPFVLVYWSRDPDGTQHNQGDSLNRLAPGINGPTARAGVANADANLKQILDFIDADPHLRATTDVFITSDHGFATISKHEIDTRGGIAHSHSASFTYRDAEGDAEVNPGWLPPGFLAIDLAHALNLPLFDSDSPVQSGEQTHYVPIDPSRPTSSLSRQRPLLGNALLGGSQDQRRSPAKVIVATNGGSDLIYLPDGDRELAGKIVSFLLEQDYTGALFVDSALGRFPGALPMSSIGLEGLARLPRPAMVVAFKSFLRDPASLLTGVQIADTPLQEGQGSHGSFGRDNTFNNMAAFGPDFKEGYLDALPVSNADIAITAAHLLGLQLPARGRLTGRLLSEALTHGPTPMATEHLEVSDPDGAGRRTALEFQQVEGHLYFDAACRIEAPAGARLPDKPCRETAN